MDAFVMRCMAFFVPLLPGLVRGATKVFRPVRASAGSGAAAAKAAQEVDEQGNDKDQPKGASTKDRSTEVKATAAQQEQEHN